MLNKIILMGRLTKDVELRMTGGGVSVASARIAVDRDFKNSNGEKETDFIDIVAWRGTAEFFERNFHKGSMVAVVGRLQMRNWTDKEGNNRTTAEVVADQIYFTGSAGGESRQTSRYAGNRSEEEDYEYGVLSDEDDEELPF